LFLNKESASVVPFILKKEIYYNYSMEEVINKEIEKVKKDWDGDGMKYNEEDVRLFVYENMRDCLKLMMSDVSY
jgi:hypothetical protein